MRFRLPAPCPWRQALLSACSLSKLLWSGAAIVGQSLGAASLAAVGLSTIVFNFSNFLFNPLMVLTTPRIARAVVNDNLAEVTCPVSLPLLLTRAIVQAFLTGSCCLYDCLCCYRPPKQQQRGCG